MPGAPPTSQEQDAWCRKCGSLRTQSIMDWGVLVPLVNNGATTVGSLLAEEVRLREAILYLEGIVTADALAKAMIARAITALKGDPT